MFPTLMKAARKSRTSKEPRFFFLLLDSVKLVLERMSIGTKRCLTNELHSKKILESVLKVKHYKGKYDENDFNLQSAQKKMVDMIRPGLKKCHPYIRNERNECQYGELFRRTDERWKSYVDCSAKLSVNFNWIGKDLSNVTLNFNDSLCEKIYEEKSKQIQDAASTKIESYYGYNTCAMTLGLRNVVNIVKNYFVIFASNSSFGLLQNFEMCEKYLDVFIDTEFSTVPCLVTN